MKNRVAIAVIAVLCASGCESLVDPRAWGNGDRDAPARAAPGRAAPKGGTASPKSAAAARPAADISSSAAEVPPSADAGKAGTGGEAGFASDRGPEALARRASAGKDGGAAVIRAAMDRIGKGTVLKGSCFDFVNAVYADAGFPADKLKIVFSGKESGPFADPALLKPGDWVYFTHMYSATVGHSAVFISWIDFENRTALTADYPGNGRAEPGRYRVADLYKVWGVRRAAPSGPAQ